MRREDFKQQGGGDAYIDWLKSKGCRFYAPMDEGNGLAELIQGWSPNIHPGKTVSYDSSFGAYFMDSIGADDDSSLMYNGKSMQSDMIGQYARDTNMTYICDFYLTADRITYESIMSYGGADNYLNVLGGTGSNRNSVGYTTRELYIRYGVPCNLNEWHTYAMRRAGSDSYGLDIYNGGVDVLWHDYNSTWGLVYNKNMDTHIMFMMACAGYIRNVYAFRTFVDDSDIMTIYNHDHQ